MSQPHHQDPPSEFTDLLHGYRSYEDQMRWYQHLAADKSKGLYYRWTFSPSTNEVTLAYNQEKRRAETDYHMDVAKRRDETDLQHGYAYRIEGGWRITDWEQHPEKDPHIKQEVIRAIHRQEGTPLPKVFE